MGRWTRRRARKSRPDWLVIDETPEMAADFQRLIAAADLGPRPTYEPDPSENETWRCQHCRRVNYANGERGCSWCFLSSPPDPHDDPSFCCERCEHLAGLIREAGGVRAMDAGLASWFEQQIEAIHR